MPAPVILVLAVPTPLGDHPALISTLLAAIRRRGWGLRIQLIGPEPEGLPEADGCIAAVYTPAIAAALRRSGMPVVDIDGSEDAGFPIISGDPIAIAKLAFAHLRELGLPALAFLGNRHRDYSRRLGASFAAAAQAAGIPCRSLEMATSWRASYESLSARSAEDRRLRSFIARLPRPCGVLTWCENYAIHFQELAASSGARPRDFAILAGGNSDSLLEPAGLSGIARDTTGMAQAAVACMAELLAGVAVAPVRQHIPPRGIIVRASTSPGLGQDERIVRVLAHLRLHPGEATSLAGLAGIAGLSQRTFTRRFRAAVGRSPVAELLRIRLDLAEDLIRGGLGLAEAARRCGFSRADHLGRMRRRRRASG